MHITWHNAVIFVVGKNATLLFLTVALIPGCTMLNQLMGMKEQLAEAQQAARIEGRVNTEANPDGALTVVLALALQEGRDPVIVDTYTRVNPGSYAFPVAAGRYQLGAYEDRNRNQIVDPGELVRPIRGSEILEPGPGEVVKHDIMIPADGAIEGQTESINIAEWHARTLEDQRHFSLWTWSVQGRIVDDFGDEMFGAEAGTRGLWKMMDFLNEGRSGIWFLQPYDPKRIPVLFVHGASGYPQEFSTLIQEIDQDRFQPWFYFYPSGFSLDGLAMHLQTLLTKLQVKHDFDEIAIVAHSMGGLVARGAILKYFEQTGQDNIRLFVTISTPWSGDPKAQGSENARIALPPVFADLSPTSEYLRWLFYVDERQEELRPLPQQVDFHMMLGFHMNSSSAVASDGAVSVASQARLEAQEQATSIRAFDYGHVRILHSPEAVTRLNLLLEESL